MKAHVVIELYDVRAPRSSESLPIVQIKTPTMLMCLLLPFKYEYFQANTESMTNTYVDIIES